MLKIKVSAYKCCVVSALLHRGETWCLGKIEVDILQRTERAMVGKICGVKLVDKKLTNDLILDWNETIDQLAKANIVQ